MDVVSLNLAEGRRLCGRQDPREIVRRLLDAGVAVVALRLGADGALLGRPPGECCHVPAWPAEVVDVTGAGNAFGGALLGGLGAGLDWLLSACGAAAELNDPEIDRAIERSATAQGFDAELHTVEISGLCPNCRAG